MGRGGGDGGRRAKKGRQSLQTLVVVLSVEVSFQCSFGGMGRFSRPQ